MYDAYGDYIDKWMKELGKYSVTSKEFTNGSKNLSAIMQSITKVRDLDNKRSIENMKLVHDDRIKDKEFVMRDRELEFKERELAFRENELERRLEFEGTRHRDEFDLRCRELAYKEAVLGKEDYRTVADVLKTVIGTGGSLLMITKIMKFEETGVIATKALGFVPKLLSR